MLKGVGVVIACFARLDGLWRDLWCCNWKSIIGMRNCLFSDST